MPQQHADFPKGFLSCIMIFQGAFLKGLTCITIFQVSFPMGLTCIMTFQVTNTRRSQRVIHALQSMVHAVIESQLKNAI